MHKNYNSCLHILDMHVERGRHQFSHRKQILVTSAALWHMHRSLDNDKKVGFCLVIWLGNAILQ